MGDSYVCQRIGLVHVVLVIGREMVENKYKFLTKNYRQKWMIIGLNLDRIIGESGVRIDLCLREQEGKTRRKE